MRSRRTAAGDYRGMSPPGRLVDRRPSLGADELLARFLPPPRFADVRFSTYRPDPEHPSQAAALATMEAFAATAVRPAEAPPRRRWRRRAPLVPDGAAGRYLDGGYGVGKTHLLASLWHQVQPTPAVYLSFGELTAVVGFLGMERAIHAFARYRLLCIDEFELDDVANTLLTVTFLRAVVGVGGRVATTSNTLPDRLGEGRFHADDFRREVAAIAGHFETLRIDGPDYRHRSGTPATAMADDAVDRALTTATGPTTDDVLEDVLTHLRTVHPVQFGPLVEGLGLVALRDLHPITDQGAALLFVALVDELYDASVPVAASGCAVDELFPASYRRGGFRKKYGRCESRLSALLGEAAS
jgi:cell division protein ZapE